MYMLYGIPVYIIHITYLLLLVCWSIYKVIHQIHRSIGTNEAALLPSTASRSELFNFLKNLTSFNTFILTKPTARGKKTTSMLHMTTSAAVHCAPVKIPPLSTFQAVRERASRFCAERNWEKFHLPTSLALALAGNYEYHFDSSRLWGLIRLTIK